MDILDLVFHWYSTTPAEPTRTPTDVWTAEPRGETWTAKPRGQTWTATGRPTTWRPADRSPHRPPPAGPQY